MALTPVTGPMRAHKLPTLKRFGKQPTFTSGITYSGSNKLDVYAPPDPAAITVVHIHGGGWSAVSPGGGDRTAGIYRGVCAHLCQHGFCVVNADYTVVPVGSGNADTSYRDTMIADVGAAVAWARANAGSYNGSTSKIALLGTSAGGHLVLMATIRGTPGATRPDAVVSWSGALRLDQYPNSGLFAMVNGLIKNMLGISTDPNGAGAVTAQAYSPYDQWTAGIATPARLVMADQDLFHTTVDGQVRSGDHTDVAARIAALGGTAVASTVTTVAGCHADFTGYSELESTVSWLRSTLGAGAPSFDPRTLGGCVVWLPSSGIGLADGAAAATWPDHSGSGHSPSQGTASKRPIAHTDGPNGTTYLRFDGVDDYLQASAFTWTQPETLFLVARYRSTTGTNALFTDGNSADSLDVYLATAAAPHVAIYAGTEVPLSSVNLGTTSFVVITAQFNGASSFVRVNGAQSATGNVGAANAGGLTLGGKADGLVQFLNCDIAEVVGYQGALSASAIGYVERALAAQYGITLP